MPWFRGGCGGGAASWVMKICMALTEVIIDSAFDF